MDSSFVLKLVMVPALIGAASLAGRRWGPAVSGWMVALPFTSAPIIFFLALAHGPAFAADSAMGTLSGGLSLAVFCVAYHLAAPRMRWPAATLIAVGALAAANLGLQYLRLPLWALAALVTAGLALSLWVVALGGPVENPPAEALPRWDIPARMLAATLFVVGITAAAPLIGPRMSGLVATFPLVAGTVTVFTHARYGAPAASGVLRGLLMGLFSFVGFYTVLIALLAPEGVGLAFAAAIPAALMVHALMLWLLRK